MKKILLLCALCLPLAAGRPKNEGSNTSGSIAADQEEVVIEDDESLPEAVRHRRAARLAFEEEDWEQAAAHISAVLARSSGDPVGDSQLYWMLYQVRERMGEYKGEILAMRSFLDRLAKIEVDEVAEGEELKDQRQTAELFLLASETEGDPGIGASEERAIVIWSPDDALFVLRSARCGAHKAGTWSRSRQSLIEKEDGTKFDRFFVRCTVGEQERMFFFETSIWFRLLAAVRDGLPLPAGFSEAQAARIVRRTLDAQK